MDCYIFKCTKKTIEFRLFYASRQLEEFIIIGSFQSEELSYVEIQEFCKLHPTLKKLSVHGNWEGLAVGPTSELYESFVNLEELR